MGKEWLYWVGGGGGGGGAGRSSRRRGKIMSEEMKEAATSAGCMCAVFQLFDLHNFQSPNLNHQHNPSDNFHSNKTHFLQEEATITSKGVEAPRNSLELEEPVSLAIKEEENLNFPVGIQIKTSRTKLSSPRASNSKSRSDFDNISSENSSINFPGTKTPTLVARLMGLDLLPECNSPSISSSSPKPKIKSRLHQRKSSRSFFDDDSSIGARSLPETPRISSARRSDVEYHRHSLQINKENINEENISPGTYARHVVKQVKDNVGRRVGLDITNTNRNREHHRRDENLILLKPTNKNPKILSRFEGEISPHGKQCSQSLFNNKNKPIINSGIKSPRVSLSSENHRPQGIVNPLKPKPDKEIVPILQEQKQKLYDSKKFGSDGKCGSSRLKKLPHQASDHAIRNKKEEPLLSKASLTDMKSKRTPLLSDILNVSGTLLQVKKDPSPPPTKLLQKQVSDALSSKRRTQLSSKPSHSYKQLQLHPKNVPQDTTNGCATALPGGASAEYGVYIQRILKRAGIIDKINPFTLAKWQNRLHPIDPSIFHHLELFHPTTTISAVSAGRNPILSRRCNRKLIFQLVDELLDEILRPHFNLKPWISPICEDDRSYLLVDELCKKIDSFPAANCLVLEDIDSLIDKDLRKSQLNGGFMEEESVVCEIEGEILEWLVREAVAVMGGGAAE